MSWATLEELRAYLPQVADLGAQRITITATGGTFTLAYGGSTTAPLAYDAPAASVQSALRGITAIGSSGVKVTGPNGGPYVAQFLGALATDAGEITVDGALLTGPSAAALVEPALDDLLEAALERSTDIVRNALRAALADPLFDYAAYGAPSTKIVRGYDTQYLRIPAHQAGSVSQVSYEMGAMPSAWMAYESTQWQEEGSSLYRATGWALGAGRAGRYLITAIWGNGPTPPAALVELVLELAVNLYRTRDTGGYVEAAGQDGASSYRLVTGLTKLQQQIVMSVRDQLIEIGV